jgi:two-component system chemotaxis sensor kinase CheA
MSNDQLAPIRVQFFQECGDLLAELEGGLLALEQGDADPEIINTVFRAAHSIKGGAGIFGMGDLVRFAHDFETVLAALRSGQIPTDSKTLKLLLHAADVLSDLVDAMRDGQAPDRDRLEATLSGLGALLGSTPGEALLDEDDLADIEFAPVASDLDSRAAPPAADRVWSLRLRPYADLYRKANDPRVLLGELGRLGSIGVTLDAGEVPLLEDLNPEESYLAWTVELTTASDEPQIRGIFEFVEGDCDLDIAERPPTDTVEAIVAPVGPPVGQASPASPPVVAAAPPTASNPTIRVDLDRIDRLIDLVSELVISEAALTEQVSTASGVGHSTLSTALEDLRHLVRDVQEGVMAIRAQPVKSLFQRMSRLIREVEAQTGKAIALTTEGEETEVDRTVIERLTDPLTHMIRNAVDHGIESPQGRRAANKPIQGSVHVTAAHRAGRVIIEVTDDGAGIDRDRVRAIAIDRGLIGSDDVLSQEEVDNLIFEPGFSTAEQVSDLSGRGVGMDVVRRSVQALGGRISVSSRRGQGSTFSLSLPLTLAVMDGMLVTVRGQCLVVPLTALVESVTPRPGDIRRLGHDIEVMAIRGAHVPLIDLGDALNYRGRPRRNREEGDPPGIVLLVEDDAGERIALRVDDLVDQRQVVIKSLEANYRPLKGIAAATIMGDGRVALIVDVNAIIGAQKIRAPDTLRQIAHA